MNKQIIFILTITVCSLCSISILKAQNNNPQAYLCSKKDNQINIKVKISDLINSKQDAYHFKNIFEQKVVNNQYQKGDKIKIDKNSKVNITFLDPNLFVYDFSVSEETQVIEGYNKIVSTIETIQEVIGGQGVSAVDEDPVNIFEEKFEDFRALINKFKIDLNANSKLYLDDNDYESINEWFEVLNVSLVELQTLQNECYDLVQSPSYPELNKIKFFTLNESFIETVKQYEEIKSTFNLIVQGITGSIGKQKAGTVVTVNLNSAPKDKNAMKEQTFSVKYFVGSKFDLRYHTGVAFSSIDEITFKGVTAGQSNFYEIIEAQNSTANAIGFIGYPIYTFNADRTSGLELTLGSNLGSFDTHYFGLTLRFVDKLSISLGGNIDTKSIDVKDKTIGTIVEDFSLTNSFGTFISINLKLL